MSESFQLDRIIRIGVLTVSDTRTSETDSGGALVQSLAEARGLKVVRYKIVKDEEEQIRSVLTKWLEDARVDAIISTGGTGIAERDKTIEAIEPFYKKEMPGFGELFRYLSFTEDIGSKALLSRASAGTSSGKAIFVLPGSRGAVKLAMEKLILPEISHIVFELSKHHRTRV